jgi:hypothetical protein
MRSPSSGVLGLQIEIGLQGGLAEGLQQLRGRCSFLGTGGNPFRSGEHRGMDGGDYDMRGEVSFFKNMG